MGFPSLLSLLLLLVLVLFVAEVVAVEVAVAGGRPAKTGRAGVGEPLNGGEPFPLATPLCAEDGGSAW